MDDDTNESTRISRADCSKADVPGNKAEHNGLTQFGRVRILSHAVLLVVLSFQSVFADGGGRNESFGYDCGLISQLNSNFPRHFGCQ